MREGEAITTLRGTVVRIDVQDRYRYRRGEPRKKLAPVSRVTIQPDPTEKQWEDEECPEPYEFDVPREFAEQMRIGMDVGIRIEVLKSP